MNFVNENMHILIMVGIGILVFLYLLNYYMNNCIDGKILILKKKIKKLQESIESQKHNIGNEEKINAQRIEESLDEKSEIDVDSYFDPTKS